MLWWLSLIYMPNGLSPAIHGLFCFGDTSGFKICLPNTSAADPNFCPSPNRIRSTICSLPSCVYHSRQTDRVTGLISEMKINRRKDIEANKSFGRTGRSKVTLCPVHAVFTQIASCIDLGKLRARACCHSISANRIWTGRNL